MMVFIKHIFKCIAYFLLFFLVCLSLYTFIVTDIMKKDYANVFGYTYFIVRTGSMSGTLEINDIIFVKVGNKVKIGDVVTYKNEEKEIITHRLVEKIGNKLIMQGDVNNSADKPITKDMVIGVVKGSLSLTFVFKCIVIFLILFIFLSLINFDIIMKRFILKSVENSSDFVADDTNVSDFGVNSEILDVEILEVSDDDII